MIVLTTWPTDRDAAPFARALVDERLAACVSVLAPMASTYRWEGAITEAHEHQVVIKTTAAAEPALRARLAALHPYDVPEYLVLPVQAGGEEYLAWIRGVVG
ncbi:MAG: divalent-cation tolerance protein CutA [Vicinamibacterales bacterium]